MLPMSAYVAAYVRFFVFLVACLCAYVLFGVFGLWAESWVSSQILGKTVVRLCAIVVFAPLRARWCLDGL